MKILLVGEFSALHKNIKEGLVSLGHDVTIVSTGDGWKKIESDINLGSNKRGLLAIADKIWKLLILPKKLKGYDVVQLVSPVVLKHLNLEQEDLTDAIKFAFMEADAVLHIMTSSQ